MANPRRSDTATTADWSFVDRPEVMNGLDKVAQLAGEWGGFDADDVRQDLYLWLAVRPEVQAKADHIVVLDLRMAARGAIRRERGREGAVEWLPLEGVE